MYSTSSETSVVFFNQKRRHAQSKLRMYMKSLYNVQILMQLKLTISYKTIFILVIITNIPIFKSLNAPYSVRLLKSFM